jgi:DnaK suppressor protein
MNKKVQEGFRKDLLDRRNILLKSVVGAEADLLSIAEEREIEMVEQAQEERLAQLLARLDERGRGEIAEIDDAITRINDGDFGLCEDCDGDIAVQRLRALPFARLCVECASERESAIGRGPADDERELRGPAPEEE